MGQKSRNKKAKAAPKKQVNTSVSAKQSFAHASVGALADSPSLIQTSTTYQPKKAGMEDLLLVRRSDIRKIVFLLVVMVVLFIALGIINATTSYLAEAGSHLAAAARL